jgi:hypothetical protein
MSNDISETLKDIAERISRMTPEEFQASLIKAGIIYSDGRLKEVYRKGERNER